MVTTLIMGIILECIKILNYYDVHLKLILYVNFTSINNKNINNNKI